MIQMLHLALQNAGAVNQNGFNVFVYGHTHVADVKWEEKTLYINPGSPNSSSVDY